MAFNFVLAALLFLRRCKQYLRQSRASKTHKPEQTASERMPADVSMGRDFSPAPANKTVASWANRSTTDHSLDFLEWHLCFVG